MELAREILYLVSAGVGLVATGIPLIITLVKLFKNKTANEN